MELHILGARGSIPTPSFDNIVYGGNTQCALLRLSDTAIIFDGGTGILNAHKVLAHSPNISSVHIFLSHYHLDHVIGLSMAQALFNGNYHVTIYAPEFEGKRPEYLLGNLFKPPYWPIKMTSLQSNISFQVISADSAYSIGDVTVKTISLNHPNGSIGFRASQGNKSVCYIFDHEHTHVFEDSLCEFIRDSDLLLMDAPYTTQDYKAKAGFGHSTIDTVTGLADKSHVKALLISHHDTNKADNHLADIDVALNEYNPNYCLAKEGMVILV